MKLHRWWAVALLIIIPASFATLAAQEKAPVPGVPARINQDSGENESVEKMKAEMAKKANKKRQEEIQHDTEKLAKLATELQEYVGKTNEHILSLDVIKKAEEIEKLAHDVKEKMKSSY
jgi:hypothetical protein